MSEMSDPQPLLHRLLAHEDLTRVETEALFGRLMDGELSEVLKSALLVALRMKGESPQEIAGAATAMRRRAVTIPHRVERVVDTCGTGGDGAGTFNISTAAALVAAAAGIPVAKHGNRSVSSRSGSADVLMALGVSLETTPEEAGRALADIGIAFLFAPALHPAMREVMPVRRELAVQFSPLIKNWNWPVSSKWMWSSVAFIVVRIVARLGSLAAVLQTLLQERLPALWLIRLSPS